LRLVACHGSRDLGAAERAAAGILKLGDGSKPDGTGRPQEANPGEIVISDLGVAVALADNDRRGGSLLEGEAKV